MSWYERETLAVRAERQAARRILARGRALAEKLCPEIEPAARARRERLDAVAAWVLAELGQGGRSP